MEEFLIAVANKLSLDEAEYLYQLVKDNQGNVVHYLGKAISVRHQEIMDTV